MKREEVYSLIDGERSYQDTLWGGRPHDDFKSAGDFLIYIEDYLRKAKTAYTTEAGNGPTMEVIRKITALGVACMEVHGAPARK